MIQEFIKKWDSRKDFLREHLETCKGEDITYSYLVEKIFKIVINDSDRYGYKNFDTEKMIVIDHGDYQGTLIFIIPAKTYQPSIEDYVVTHNYYGSCSGCDTLMWILEYEDGYLSESQIDELMTLCLHLVQKMKFLGDDGD